MWVCRVIVSIRMAFARTSATVLAMTVSFPELFRVRLSLLLSVRLGRNPLHRMPHQPVCAGSARPYLKS